MRRIFSLAFCMIFSSYTAVRPQGPPPKQELRGAWIASVINLDWPSSPGLSTSAQQAELVALLDELANAGINAVFFQVRPECDAFYDSPIEPWSFYLNGQQGRAPAPFYDPLTFAVEEAHKRGMEIHAWFNPFRAERQVGSYAVAANHVTRQHPDWIIRKGDLKVLNPGLPEVRQYIAGVITDVVSRYDVDGIHFDDYFYPYPPNEIQNEDAAAFSADPRGFSNIRDWRRDNINLLIEMIYAAIQNTKPFVKFGISPFGIWRNGVPAGIVGLDAYNTIYADALAWLDKAIVDYVAPQLYWPFGGGQDYGKLQPWWASQAQSAGRHLYVGQAVYRIPNWPANEMRRQLNLNRSNSGVQGSIFFRAAYFAQNPLGFTEMLQNDFYPYPALTPAMPWKDQIAPNRPRDVRYERLADTGGFGLAWTTPEPAADGQTARRYAVYRFDSPHIAPADLEDPANLLLVAGFAFSTPPVPAQSAGSAYYVLTAVDGNSNESAMSEILEVRRPEQPAPLAPAQDTVIGQPVATLRWSDPGRVAAFQLQLGPDSTFARDLVVNEMSLVDSQYVVSTLEGQVRYFWQVRAENAGGIGEFSPTADFFTGFPATPALVFPTNHNREQALNLTFVWRRAAGAESYDFIVATSRNFEAASVTAQAAALADTAFTPPALAANTWYYWRVRAANAIGPGNWSEIFRFMTGAITDVAGPRQGSVQYALLQNYPNPFNPETTISFSLGRAGHATLKVYDVLGREVATLVDRDLPAGRQQVRFEASALASGLYYYRLVVGERVFTRKMLLLH